MAITRAPIAHRVWLRDVLTGERIDRWPVDARELVRSGSYVVDAGDEGKDSDTVPPGGAPAADDSDESGDSPSATADAVAAVPIPASTPDPMPHVTTANAENAAMSPTGAPLVIAPAEGVTRGAPVQLPTGRRPRGQR